ncbi:hypothetical protein HG536_0H04250 [Torulaspora globosa]|uniref:Uncharacterized protein n=1 Tax=Torulaspora globosa TaxID=48254 RepID=A0A7G3ZNG3_9SACH|nr:uncharacterized protein HG536_0H04250 [Torulaspora globosa]QLL35049.1 hypothetical protein HG536_0H04250 [Torulaspora globosa]
MELEALRPLLLAKDVNLDWLRSKVNNQDCLYCRLIIPSDTLLFCFVPLLDKQPYVALLRAQDLEEQSRNQGFLESSIDQILAALREQAFNPPSALSFRKDDGMMEISINLSTALKLSLKATIVDNDPSLSSIILRRLLDDILAGSYLLERLLSSRTKLLDSKDRAIEFLKENLEELGDKQTLNRWAPEGSMNYQSLQKYDEDEVKYATFARINETASDEGPSEDAETADLVLTLRREMKQYKMSWSKRSTKKTAAKMPSDFAPPLQLDAEQVKSDWEKGEASVKLEEPPSLVKEESPVAGESASSGRESSKSPSKKRKFRRVKITKQSSV